MKRFLIPGLMLVIASSTVFAFGTQVSRSSHAQSGYDHKDMVVVLVANPAEAKRVWLVATYSYPFLLSERDKLLNLVQAASKKIAIAITNKTTFSYTQDLGSFYTDNAALVAVSFDTQGYEASYVVVRSRGTGTTSFFCSTRRIPGISSTTWAMRAASSMTIRGRQSSSIELWREWRSRGNDPPGRVPPYGKRSGSVLLFYVKEEIEMSSWSWLTILAIVLIVVLVVVIV